MRRLSTFTGEKGFDPLLSLFTNKEELHLMSFSFQEEIPTIMKIAREK